MTQEEYEIATLERAKDGDVDAAVEAVRLCAYGLDSGVLSERLSSYLAERLHRIAEGSPADEALNTAVKRKRGRRKEPFPSWEEPIGAFAAILAQRGYRAEAVNDAMCHLRQLDRKEAQRIRKTYAPMLKLTEERLLHFCTAKVRALLDDFPPQT